jgi:hypothetical protein
MPALTSFKTFYLTEAPKDKANKLAKTLELSFEDSNIQRYLELDTKNQLKGEHKDISKIKSKDQLKDLLGNYSDHKSGKEQKKEIKQDAEKIFENDKILVVIPKTYEASCTYGSNTKWCTTWRGEPSHFNNYNKTYNIHYIIPKAFGKIAVLIDTNGEVNSVWDAADSQHDIQWLKEKLKLSGYGEVEFEDIPWKKKEFNITDYYSDGNFRLSENDVVTNLDGIPKIETLSGEINIVHCRLLKNVDAFKGLQSVNEGLSLYSCNSLSNLDGFQEVKYVRHLIIYECPALTNLDGFQNLRDIDQSLMIQTCNNLTNIDGLSNVRRVGFSVCFSKRYSLIMSQGLLSLTNLNGFKNLTTIGEDLILSGCKSLTNVDGLKNIKSIGGHVHLQDCAMANEIGDMLKGKVRGRIYK